MGEIAMTTEKLLEELESKEKVLRQELSVIKAQIRQTKLEIIKEKYKCSIGTIVIYNSKLYKISFIDTTWFPGKPWVKGYQKKKDGSWGIGERDLYSEWELAKEND